VNKYKQIMILIVIPFRCVQMVLWDCFCSAVIDNN
jgi:hypothetical protein